MRKSSGSECSDESNGQLHPPNEVDLSELSDEDAKAFFLRGRREDRAVLGKRDFDAKPQSSKQKIRDEHFFTLTESRFRDLQLAKQKYSVKAGDKTESSDVLTWSQKVVENFVQVRRLIHKPVPVMIIGNPLPEAEIVSQQQKLLRNKATFLKVFQGQLKLPPKDSILRELLSAEESSQPEVMLRWVTDWRTARPEPGQLTQWQAKWVYGLLTCLMPPFSDDTHSLVDQLFKVFNSEADRFQDCIQSSPNYRILLTVLVNCMLTPDTW